MGLIRALNAFRGEVRSDRACAELACKLEIELCQSPIGKQDQYAASFGGLKVYKFNQDYSVSVQSVACNKNTIEKLNKKTLVFYIGGDRNTNEILRQQSVELLQKKKQSFLSRAWARACFQRQRPSQKNCCRCMTGQL